MGRLRSGRRIRAVPLSDDKPGSNVRRSGFQGEIVGDRYDCARWNLSCSYFRPLGKTIWIWPYISRAKFEPEQIRVVLLTTPGFIRVFSPIGLTIQGKKGVIRQAGIRTTCCLQKDRITGIIDTHDGHASDDARIGGRGGG